MSSIAAWRPGPTASIAVVPVPSSKWNSATFVQTQLRAPRFRGRPLYGQVDTDT